MTKNLSIKTRTLNFFRLLAKFRVVENFLLLLINKKIMPGFAKKAVPNNYQYDHGTIRKITINGINYELDISDYMEHEIYFQLALEDYNGLLKEVDKDFCVLDIGANIGNTMLEIAAKLNNTGIVYGFEPVPFLFNKALNNLSLNNFTNIKLNNVAVSSEPGFVFFDDFTENYNRGGIFMSFDKKKFKIEAITVDEFVNRENLEKIDLIKADIEGFEMEMLKGATQTLEKYRPKLFLEFDQNLLSRAGSSAKEMLKFLDARNYICYNAKTANRILFSDNLDDLHTDIVAYPN